MSGFSQNAFGGDGNLILTAVKSPDYVPGVSGWAIFRNGDVEFNGGTFRGVVTASEFSAIINVAAGAYAGQYAVLTLPFTDSLGNQLAVLTWFNQTSPPLVSPYIAGVSGPGAGAIANIQSGQEDAGDSAAALWLESKEASGLPGPLALFDAEFFQPLGGAGVTLAMAANGAFGMVVDTWHSQALGTGWAPGGGVAGVFAQLLDNGNVFLAWDVTTSTSSNPNPVCTLPAGYQPATTVQLQSGHASGAPAAYTAAFAPSIKVQGSGAVVGQGIPALAGTVELFGSALVPMGSL